MRYRGLWIRWIAYWHCLGWLLAWGWHTPLHETCNNKRSRVSNWPLCWPQTDLRETCNNKRSRVSNWPMCWPQTDLHGGSSCEAPTLGARERAPQSCWRPVHWSPFGGGAKRAACFAEELGKVASACMMLFVCSLGVHFLTAFLNRAQAI
jgi:hypothetical protein